MLFQEPTKSRRQPRRLDLFLEDEKSYSGTIANGNRRISFSMTSFCEMIGVLPKVASEDASSPDGNLALQVSSCMGLLSRDDNRNGLKGPKICSFHSQCTPWLFES